MLERRAFCSAEKIWGRAGFEVQVKVTSRSTLLFHLPMACGKLFRQKRGKFQPARKPGAREELVHMTHTEPENFSP